MDKTIPEIIPDHFDTTCNFTANGVPGSFRGTLSIWNCNPPISKEHIGYIDVILIVGAIVAVGLIVQYIVHHINIQALKQIKDDIVDAAKQIPDVVDVKPAEVELEKVAAKLRKRKANTSTDVK